MTSPTAMTDEFTAKKEILEKAIQRAIDNGWQVDLTMITGQSAQNIRHWKVGESPYGKLMVFVNSYGESPFDVIFDHSFAKALWPPGVPDSGIAGDWTTNSVNFPSKFVAHRNLSPYEYHLQQMVVSDDPIQYLGEHLDG